MNNQQLSSELTDLRQPHLKVWLAACRWALAVGLTLSVLAGLYIRSSADILPISIAPERINPNTAPLASLMRLPGIGKVRAADIIKYRETMDEPAFDTAASLEKVEGIGSKTSEKINEYLTFEGE